ncbi:MAG TPA: pseudaminic acid synthase [Aliidongia sp.]|nr:pseudaminic acid synthase [Aliidongia sp.]
MTAEPVPTPRPIRLKDRSIGPGHPPFIIAEMSGNHNGDLGRALALIEAAKEAGADAVKLQTYTADTITIDHDGPGFVIDKGLWRGRRLYELYQEAHTPWEWHDRLFEHAREIGIIAFSTPFDASAVALLERLETPAYKIASFELIDLPLIELAAGTGKPLVMSTGLASSDEIGEAVAAARKAGGQDIMLLHCVSGYPTPPREMNLATMAELGRAHQVLFGLSDHTLSTAVSVAAVALGASVIEKHFTLRRADGGPDAEFSLEADELARLVADCRTAWEAIGTIRYDEVPSEQAARDHRRSIYVVTDIAQGETLSAGNIRSIRPGLGLPPKHLPELLGKKAARSLKRGTPLEWDMVQ